MANVITPEADEILDVYFPVLDNGFIALKGYFGGDESIVEAARNSYSKGTKKVSDDRGLIRRLIRDKHTSPIEFVELKFHIRAPLYIIQQWLRHRTNNLCQESHRFSEIKDDFQRTQPDAWRLQDKKNKQGSDGFLPLKTVEQGDWNGEDMSSGELKLHEHLRQEYQTRINRGVAREQARKDVPHSTYSSLYVKCDLHNILHFLKLRTDPHAQQEIRDYADLMAGMVKRVCPLTFEAWVDYAYAAKSFSRLDILFFNYCVEEMSLGCSLKTEEWKDWYSEQSPHWNEKPHEKIGLGKTELADFWTKLKPVEIPLFDLDLAKAKRME